MDVNDAVDINWTIREVVSAVVVIALASFCSPGLQPLHHKGKNNLCVLAKTPTKVCIRKSNAQQPVQFVRSAGDVSLHRLNFSPRSLFATGIHSDIARGSLTLRERAPPV
jgi:hypothetical protein